MELNINNFLLSVFFGFLQGVTEFLPISSSGHLVLFHDFFGFDFPDNNLFDAVLHLGTAFALAAFFIPEMLQYFASDGEGKKDFLKKFPLHFVFFATIPALAFGFLFEDIIVSRFRNAFSVSLSLIVFGILLFIFDRFSKQEKEIEGLSFTDALVIGIFQILAFIPGVSRSLVTIIAGLGLKLKRKDAAYFSFLLGMPVTFGAGAKKLLDADFQDTAGTLLVFAGFFAAFLSGFFCIKFFLKYLSGNTLKPFAYYRVILGFLVLVTIFARAL